MLEGAAADIIFTGDAAKNRAEILSRTADMTYDQTSAAPRSSSSGRCGERSGTVLVPGHDIPMVLDQGEPRYLCPREGGIAAWFGATLDQLTLYDLTL